jgi:hypothetical protein
MRKFKFIGDPKDYNNDVIFGEIYLENYKPNGGPLSVIGYFGLPEWEEVIEKVKPLHKDTDLGYFAGLAMGGMLSSRSLLNDNQLCFESIKLAKELIKQLDNELE